MASWFQLGLDTHAPVVTFGTPDSSGGALSVPYSTDEPGIASAWVIDAAGLRVDLEVQATRLWAALPGSITAGNATVYARAVDDVGNERTCTLVVLLAGVAPPAEPPPTQIVPGRAEPPDIARPRPRKFITSRSRLRGSCPATVKRGVVRSVSGVGTSSSASTQARVSDSSTLTAGSSARTTAVVRAGDAARVAAELSNVTVRRRDGRAIEEALLLDLW